MKPTCKEQGFESDKAQMYAKNSSGHYKLWDPLEITFIVFTGIMWINLC